MSSHLRSLGPLVFALPFALYDYASLECFVISYAVIIFRYHCISGLHLHLHVFYAHGHFHMLSLVPLCRIVYSPVIYILLCIVFVHIVYNNPCRSKVRFYNHRFLSLFASQTLRHEC